MSEALIRNTTPGRRVFTTLDGIRGVAAILVAMLHTDPFFGMGRLEQTHLAVDIFFLLSGVVIANAYEQRLLAGLGTWRFTVIRAIRIYPLYILACTITLLAMFFGIADEVQVGNVALCIILALTLLPNPFTSNGKIYPLDGPAWTLFFEMAANIAYAACIRFLNVRILLAIMGTSAIGLILALYLKDNHSLALGWTMKGFPFAFFRVGYSFFAGVLLFRIFTAGIAPLPIRAKHQPYVSILVLAVIGAILASDPSDAARPYFDFVFVTIVFPIIIYCALWCEPSGMVAIVFRGLGAISYALYVLHQPIARVVHNVLDLHGVKVETYAPYGGVYLLLGLGALCLVLDRVFDSPARRWLLSRFAARDKRQSAGGRKTSA